MLGWGRLIQRSAISIELVDQSLVGTVELGGVYGVLITSPSADEVLKDHCLVTHKVAENVFRASTESQPYWSAYRLIEQFVADLQLTTLAFEHQNQAYGELCNAPVEQVMLSFEVACIEKTLLFRLHSCINLRPRSR